jgi:hypothetical protein
MEVRQHLMPTAVWRWWWGGVLPGMDMVVVVVVDKIFKFSSLLAPVRAITNRVHFIYYSAYDVVCSIHTYTLSSRAKNQKSLYYRVQSNCSTVPAYHRCVWYRVHTPVLRFSKLYMYTMTCTCQCMYVMYYVLIQFAKSTPPRFYMYKFIPTPIHLTFI